MSDPKNKDQKPQDDGELSDEALEQVAGGLPPEDIGLLGTETEPIDITEGGELT